MQNFNTQLTTFFRLLEFQDFSLAIQFCMRCYHALLYKVNKHAYVLDSLQIMINSFTHIISNVNSSTDEMIRLDGIFTIIFCYFFIIFHMYIILYYLCLDSFHTVVHSTFKNNGYREREGIVVLYFNRFTKTRVFNLVIILVSYP